MGLSDQPWITSSPRSCPSSPRSCPPSPPSCPCWPYRTWGLCPSPAQSIIQRCILHRILHTTYLRLYTTHYTLHTTHLILHTTHHRLKNILLCRTSLTTKLFNTLLHTVHISIWGRVGDIGGKIEGIFGQNRGQIRGNSVLNRGLNQSKIRKTCIFNREQWKSENQIVIVFL